MITELMEEEGAKEMAKSILELELTVKVELRKKKEEFMQKLHDMDQKMDSVISALQAMKERNSKVVNANSSMPFRHPPPRGGHMNRPPPNYTTTRFFNINTGPEIRTRPGYYDNQFAEEMTPNDGFPSFQAQAQQQHFRFSTATSQPQPQFASFDPAKSPPEIPTTENMSAAVAELFNGHGVANGSPAGMAMTDDANHSNKENKVMVTHESVEKRIIDLTVGYRQPYVDLSPAADRASNAILSEKPPLAQAQKVTQNIDLATEKMVKTKTSKTKTAGELYAEISGLNPVEEAERMYLASLEARKRPIPLPPISLPSVTTTSTTIASKLVSTTTNLAGFGKLMATTSSLLEAEENVDVTKTVYTSPPPLTPATPASGKSEGSSAMVGGFGKRRLRK